MKSKRIILTGFLAALAGASLMAGSVFADQTKADTADTAQKQSKLEKALAKYDRTGKMKRCVTPQRVRNTRVVDDTHIIFEMTGRQVYLNSLPRRCPRLGYLKSISYEVRGGTICNNDLFSAFDSVSVDTINCVFGEFEALTLKPKKPEPKPE